MAVCQPRRHLQARRQALAAQPAAARASRRSHPGLCAGHRSGPDRQPEPAGIGDLSRTDRDPQAHPPDRQDRGSDPAGGCRLAGALRQRPALPHQGQRLARRARRARSQRRVLAHPVRRQRQAATGKRCHRPGSPLQGADPRRSLLGAARLVAGAAGLGALWSGSGAGQPGFEPRQPLSARAVRAPLPRPDRPHRRQECGQRRSLLSAAGDGQEPGGLPERGHQGGQGQGG